MLALIQAALAAFVELAGAVKGYMAWRQAQDMQKLGQLEQRNVVLEAENASLRARLASLGALGSPGAPTGSDKL